MLLGIAIAWAVEIFVIQEMTFQPDINRHPTDLAIRSGVRFAFDLFSAIAVVMLAPAIISYILFVLAALGMLIEIAHTSYFNTPLSFLAITNQGGEGIAVFNAFVSQIPPIAGLIIFAALLAKIALLRKARSTPQHDSIGIGVASLLLLAIMATALLGYSRPVEFDHRNRAYWAHSYGAVIAGLHEIAQYGSERIQAEATAAVDSTSDRLNNAWIAPDARHIIVIQAESLDYDALFARVDSEPLMPFLSSLALSGCYERIRAIHPTSSADSDFVLLSGHMPNGIITPYDVPGFELRDPLPALASRHGWQVDSFHGNVGTFFNRGTAFGEMGFSNIFFSPDFVKAGFDSSSWGILDHDVLEFAAERLRSSDQPTLQFIITMSTHLPYEIVPTSAIGNPVTPEPAGMSELYLNNMRYLDETIQRYVGLIPDNSLVVVYGDHASRADYDSKIHDDELEFVPVVAFFKGDECLQCAPLAQASSDLTSLDVASFVRKLATSRPRGLLNDP